ncbi:hypothetical protein QFC19_003657 [Naganishia cerealis]|uniref:Uncharacterized protein n=1 Tax=Naganishia cerealis TaxID=610337 RepID=A0ACC2W2D3_9TREE|nr:hypothetical protein QFC19_003657 [Naganishia cerealis]
METPSTKRVAVIGAGAAGLVQAKQVLDAFRSSAGQGVELVVFESRKDVGGVWLENPDAGAYLRKHDPTTNSTRIIPAEPGVLPSPIYPGLRTNLPKHLMAYRDTPFQEDVPLFPRAQHVEDYLRAYAIEHGLLQYIRFDTTVTRVYKEKQGESGEQPRWIVQSRRNGDAESRSEEYEFVSVTSGHYEKASVPEIAGLDKFTGEVMHSRWYRRPEDFIGKNVLVVGSFASGSDIARELASLNLPSSALPESMTAYKVRRPADQEPGRSGKHEEQEMGIYPTLDNERKIRVYQSSSQTPNMFTSGLAADTEDDARPWLRLIEQRPLIDRIETPSQTSNSNQATASVIYFKDGSSLTGIDVVIFATGYLYYYPFFKNTDYPWNQESDRVLDGVIEDVDVDVEARQGRSDRGGLQGLGMRQMDSLMLFLKNDRSMAMIGLRKCTIAYKRIVLWVGADLSDDTPGIAYQVVPFPLFEIQSHLVALLWADRLPNFPTYPRIPPNPMHEAPPTPPETPGNATAIADLSSQRDDFSASNNGLTKQLEKRYTEKVRGAYVFGFPYEFHYENYLLSLTAEADGGKEGGWGEVEEFRWYWRKQKELRFQTIGY